MNQTFTYWKCWAALVMLCFHSPCRNASGHPTEGLQFQASEQQTPALSSGEPNSVKPTVAQQESDQRVALTRRYEPVTTATGECYAILGPAPRKPAPTIVVLSGSAEQSLTNPYFLQCGLPLLDKGYLCISVDLPCHGQEVRPGEAEGLEGWNARLDNGQPLVEEFNKRLKRVLDDLIAKQLTDASRIAICGTSRGGFLAFHAAANDPRVRCVIGMAPVTSLLKLTEFEHSMARERAGRLDLKNLAAKLAGRKAWIVIGDQDLRVGTDEAIALARRLSDATLEQKLTPGVDLLVLAEPRGHTLPEGSADSAAKWLEQQFASSKGASSK